MTLRKVLMATASLAFAACATGSIAADKPAAAKAPAAKAPADRPQSYGRPPGAAAPPWEKPRHLLYIATPGDDGADQRVEGMSGHFPRRRSR